MGVIGLRAELVEDALGPRRVRFLDDEDMTWGYLDRAGPKSWRELGGVDVAYQVIGRRRRDPELPDTILILDDQGTEVWPRLVGAPGYWCWLLDLAIEAGFEPALPDDIETV